MKQKIILLSVIFLSYCVKNKSESGGGADEPVKRSSPQPEETSSKDDTPAVSADVRTFVNSFSNNPYTSRTINKSAAATEAEKLSNAIKDGNANALVAFISANRLSGRNLSDALNAAKTLVDQIVKKGGTSKDLPDSVKLELAINAMMSSKLAFTETLAEGLLKARDPRIRAATHNLLGVIALRQDRIPESVYAFNEALKEEKNFTAARLNLGFLALRGGDLNLAKKMLGDMQEDWFVESGLLIVDRLSGDASRADQLCSRILQKRPTHKPSLYNCALNEFQGKRNFKAARDLLNRMLKTQGGSLSWDDRAGHMLGVIDMEEANSSQAKRPAAAPAQDPKKAAEPAKK